MFYLSGFLIATVSPILWVFNAEALAVLGGLVGGRPWPLVALALALGQCVTFSLCYAGGERLALRWGSVRRRLEALRADPARFERYRRASTGWLFVGAVLGLPPTVALSALCPVFGTRFGAFLATVLTGRFLRFAVLAGVPQLFAGALPLDALPAWLKALA